MSNVGPSRELMEDMLQDAPSDPAEKEMVQRAEQRKVSSRQSDYMKRQYSRGEEKADASFAEIMKLRQQEREKKEEEFQERQRQKEEELEQRRQEDRKMVDDEDEDVRHDELSENPVQADDAQKQQRWDATPAGSRAGGNRWDATPMATGAAKNRWDATPAQVLETEQKKVAEMSGEELKAYRVKRQMLRRNRPLSDTELDEMLPGADEGYDVVSPPASYEPVPRTPLPADQLQTPAAVDAAGYAMDEEMEEMLGQATQPVDETLPTLKPEDVEHFGDLLRAPTREEESNAAKVRDRQVLSLLLSVKNGEPPQRKKALRTLANNAVEFGADALFARLLPLLRSMSLEDQERHLLVKVLDRVMFKLGERVKPHVRGILVVIEPMLIDEDFYARVEGREVISNLAKAAGLPAMTAAMRPDIDHADDFVRNTTARAFAVVAAALGVEQMLPFLSAVCRSKQTWQARHTGIKIVQQVAVLIGVAVLPHLNKLVECVRHGLEDEHPRVRTISGLALAALAESAYPYGIEAFQHALHPLFRGIKMHRSKTLAAFLKAVGYIIPLMEPELANFSVREAMPVILREFSTSDDEMVKILLAVVRQCVAAEGVSPSYLRVDVLPSYFRHFWVRRMAADRRTYRELIQTTVEIASKVGGAEVIGRIVGDLRDEQEQFRRMTLDTVERVLRRMMSSGEGGGALGQRLEALLVDGVMHAFQEQQSEDSRVLLKCFETVMDAVGAAGAVRYLGPIGQMIKFRLANKSPRVREQAADLIARLAAVMQRNGCDQLLRTLGRMLYEMLGEEYPEVLGSLLSALSSMVAVMHLPEMEPPIRDLLPRLTPILRNRHEKVQEHCIVLVGRIADRVGTEFAEEESCLISPKEWMRICFDLIELLRAQKKSVRRATMAAFGYIAKTIGPSDVLATLLNNLRVQERINRVCTTIAIAIVADTCGAFTVVPALMNEYRVPDINVQNGVLKSLTYLFEHIGEQSRHYIYALTPLLVDALQERDAMHRQTAAWAIKHLALNVTGYGVEDALAHLMNHVWPNLFDTALHLIVAVSDSLDGLRVGLGPGPMLFHLIAGLFHPARKVRNCYWRLYNTLYLGAQDQLVAFYPLIKDAVPNAAHTYAETLERAKKGLPPLPQPPKNTYARHELDMFL
ncbi:MAG: hypothetical protein MHM6MM_004426 [Cercozoa sp. M6MM]